MAHRAAHHQLPAERTSDGQRPIKWHKQTLTVEPFKNHLARANVATEGAPARFLDFQLLFLWFSLGGRCSEPPKFNLYCMLGLRRFKMQPLLPFGAAAAGNPRIVFYIILSFYFSFFKLFHCVFKLSGCLLSGCLFGRLGSWLVSWLVGWLVDRSDGWIDFGLFRILKRFLNISKV